MQHIYYTQRFWLKIRHGLSLHPESEAKGVISRLSCASVLASRQRPEGWGQGLDQGGRVLSRGQCYEADGEILAYKAKQQCKPC